MKIVEKNIYVEKRSYLDVQIVDCCVTTSINERSKRKKAKKNNEKAVGFWGVPSFIVGPENAQWHIFVCYYMEWEVAIRLADVDGFRSVDTKDAAYQSPVTQFS